MSTKKSSVSEYMKIRRYMLRFVEQTGSHSVQVPTILELTKQFNVSRPTVSKAMKALTADGYIIGRKGIGGFTNPAKFQFKEMKLRSNTVAILCEDGMLVQYGSYFTGILGEVFRVLARNMYSTSMLQLCSHDSKRIKQEIQLENFNVLLWINPVKEMLGVIEELRSDGVKVITSGICETGSKFNTYMDYEGMGYCVGKALIAEKRHNVVYLIDQHPWSFPLAGMKRAYAEEGIELDPNLFLSDPSLEWNDLSNVLESNKRIDAVFNAVCSTKIFLPFYYSLPKEVLERCRFIVPNLPDSCVDFCGWTFKIPVQEHAEAIGQLVEQVINNTSSLNVYKSSFSIMDVDCDCRKNLSHI